VLLASLQTELAANGLTPSDIELELTEAALEGEVEGIVALLARFSEAGFRLVIDDFGTKHAHLAYLKRSLITKLKIDHSFMRDIATDMDAAAIVRGIISLAHSLGLRAAADGVVYQAQLECLLAAGCTEAQGDLLAKPMSAVQFQERF
jgi:EAL domain-containing protein (putative c-di-GMP-specific phosphodiesterase class I)